jgi:hypothetical protein
VSYTPTTAPADAGATDYPEFFTRDDSDSEPDRVSIRWLWAGCGRCKFPAVISILYYNLKLGLHKMLFGEDDQPQFGIGGGTYHQAAENEDTGIAVQCPQEIRNSL